MKQETVDKILKLNKDFYGQVSKSFSQTRQYPWKGWGRVVEIFTTELQDKEMLRILDLGCGNGRFFEYLKRSNLQQNLDYYGYDISSALIKEASEKYNDGTFKSTDMLTDLKSLDGTYDFIVAFGLTHHIPSNKLRTSWFRTLTKFISKDGHLVLTFWGFEKDPRFKKAVKSILTKNVSIKETEFEEGDYFLGWQGQKEIFRYVHIYSELELENITKIITNNNMALVDSFLSDGRSNNLNKYLIFKKY